MKGWRTFKLSEIAEIQTGPFGSQLHNNDYVDLGTPIVTVEHLGSRKFTTQNLPCVSNEDKARLSKYVLNEGDIVFSRVGSVDRCSYVTSDEDGWMFSGRCLRVRCDKICNPLYLYYYFCKETVKQYIRSIAVGATMPSINTKLLSDLPVTLPSIDIQNKAAQILSRLDDKIELNKRINDNLEQQAQALYKSWFLDFEPFKDGNFVESELGLIPEGWEVRDIYKYTDVIYGAPYKSSLFNENKEGYPLIRIRDLKSFAPQFYTQEILPQTEYIIAGDVVAGMDAEFTPYIWQGEKGVLNQRCCKFKGQYPWVSNYYLLNLLKPELEYVQSYKTGTTVSHLGKADIDRFKVITPPESIVKAFSVIVNSLLEQKIKSAYEIRNLTSTRDSLLPKLMSGELKINEIDC